MRPSGPDAVWQTHADYAASLGIFACEECKGEPVSASITFEDGDTMVGESCYQKWKLRDHPDRKVPL